MYRRGFLTAIGCVVVAACTPRPNIYNLFKDVPRKMFKNSLHLQEYTEKAKVFRQYLPYKYWPGVLNLT